MTDKRHTCTCGQPTSGGWLCDRCQTTLAHAFTNIGSYAHELDTVAQRRTRFGNGPGKGSIGKTQPLPVDMRFLNAPSTGDQDTKARGANLSPGQRLRSELRDTLATWTRDVVNGLPSTANRPHRSVRGMAHYLGLHHTWITKQTWAPQILEEVLDLERRLSRFIDRPADKWYAGRCHVENQDGVACDTELYATTARGYIDCHGCGIRHDVAERRAFLLMEAAEYQVTATEAAGALLAWTDYDGSETKLVDRIRKWRDRDVLDVADVTSLKGRDRHLYRLGDIQKLLIDDAQTRQDKKLGAA